MLLGYPCSIVGPCWLGFGTQRQVQTLALELQLRQLRLELPLAVVGKLVVASMMAAMAPAVGLRDQGHPEAWTCQQQHLVQHPFPYPYSVDLKMEPLHHPSSLPLARMGFHGLATHRS